MRILVIAALLLAACSPATPESSARSDSGSPASPATRVAAAHQTSDTITVYKTPTCGCCAKWVDHLREHGYHVNAIDQNDLSEVKSRLGVSSALQSCHTATVGGYVVEGHVPAADIRRLLAERPSVTGLAVPGMPSGSPGMEGFRSERYDVLAFDKGGATKVFASH
jgi:hypothetical protein